MNDSLTMPHQNISEMESGSPVAGYYLLQTASIRKAASGKTFLSATVSDRTGSVNVIYWDYNGPIRASDEGKPVFLRGLISDFKGAPQLTLEAIRPVNESDVFDVSKLVPTAPIDADKMYEDILSIVENIADPDYKAVAKEFLDCHSESFREIPAAKSVHHGFLHGLLMHTGNMVKIACQLADLYPQVINRDLLITGTLIHDFAKREEFTFSQLGLVSGYSVKGDLLGHLVMGAQEVSEICWDLEIPEEKSVLLQHLLLSHHGKPEYGAAVVPLCAEAELLSLIDAIDSRMEIYRENLEETPLGQFSDRIFALDGRRAYHHYEPQK